LKSVTIRIHEGKISADYTGFVGKACEALDDRIRPEGLVVEEKELKPEHGFVTAGDQQQTVESNW